MSYTEKCTYTCTCTCITVNFKSTSPLFRFFSICLFQAISLSLDALQSYMYMYASYQERVIEKQQVKSIIVTNLLRSN